MCKTMLLSNTVSQADRSDYGSFGKGQSHEDSDRQESEVMPETSFRYKAARNVSLLLGVFVLAFLFASDPLNTQKNALTYLRFESMNGNMIFCTSFYHPFSGP